MKDVDLFETAFDAVVENYILCVDSRSFCIDQRARDDGIQWDPAHEYCFLNKPLRQFIGYDAIRIATSNIKLHNLESHYDKFYATCSIRCLSGQNILNHYFLQFFSFTFFIVYCYCLTFSLFGLFILDIFTKFIFFNISYMYNLWHKELRYIRTKSTFSHSNITGTPHIHVMGRNPLQIYLINQVCYKS